VHGYEWVERAADSYTIAGPHCSWDGSLHPDLFMSLVREGATLTPTDKNYKVYVETEVQEGAEKLRIMSRASHNPGTSPVYGAYRQVKDVDLSDVNTAGWSDFYPEDWVQLAPIGTRRHDKFYFEHLSGDQKEEFVALLNAKKIALAFPGRFYRLPFFVVT